MGAIPVDGPVVATREWPGDQTGIPSRGLSQISKSAFPDPRRRAPWSRAGSTLEGGSAMEHIDVIIVGAGQAGLAPSHELTAAGMEQPCSSAAASARRGDTATTASAWSPPTGPCGCPATHTTGRTPTASCPAMRSSPRLEDYADSFGAPVREGVLVTGLSRCPMAASSCMLDDGGFEQPRAGAGHRRLPAASPPGGGRQLPAGLLQIDVDAYQNEGALPPGRGAGRRQRPVRRADQRGVA